MTELHSTYDQFSMSILSNTAFDCWMCALLLLYESKMGL